MKNLLLILGLICQVALFSQPTIKSSPRHLEVGFIFGVTNYSGDIAQKNIHISETNLGYGAFARYFFSNKFSAKAHLYSGTISGDDANSKDPIIQRRSFRFGTNLTEVGLSGEWHPLGKDRFSSTGMHRSFLSPYLYLGVGATFSSAKVEYYGTPEDRSVFITTPFPEVGPHQRFLIAPMGAGVRVELNESLVLGAELGWRPVFSDDLDGVRLNGNPEKNDWYYFGGATIAFIFGGSKTPL